MLSKRFVGNKDLCNTTQRVKFVEITENNRNPVPMFKIILDLTDTLNRHDSWRKKEVQGRENESKNRSGCDRNEVKKLTQFKKNRKRVRQGRQNLRDGGRLTVTVHNRLYDGPQLTLQYRSLSGKEW